MSNIEIGANSSEWSLTVNSTTSADCGAFVVPSTTNEVIYNNSISTGGPYTNGNIVFSGNSWNDSNLDTESRDEVLRATASSRKTRHIIKFINQFKDAIYIPTIYTIYVEELNDRFQNNEIEKELKMEVLLLLGN